MRKNRKYTITIKILIIIIIVFLVEKALPYLEKYEEVIMDNFSVVETNILSEELEDTEEVVEEPEEVLAIVVREDGYYFSLLTDEEQELYKYIAAYYLCYYDTIDIADKAEGMDVATVTKVRRYILLDYPEIFWFNEESSYNKIETEDGEKIVSINTSLTYTLEEIESYKEELEIIEENINQHISDCETDYEKAVGVYEYMILNCQYNYDAYEIIVSSADYTLEVEESSSIIGSLINGSAVCSGIAKGYLYILNNLEINTISALGISDGYGHEWNMILLDGEYYNVDCTNGNSVSESISEDRIIYNFFGMTTEQYSTIATLDETIEYPDCTATKYNYYAYNGVMFEIYEYNEIDSIMGNAIEARSENVTIAFSNIEEFEEASNDLSQEGFSKIISKYSDVLDEGIRYMILEDLKLIIIEFEYE